MSEEYIGLLSIQVPFENKIDSKMLEAIEQEVINYELAELNIKKLTELNTNLHIKNHIKNQKEVSSSNNGLSK